MTREKSDKARLKAVAALAAFFEGAQAAELLSYLPEDERETCSGLLGDGAELARSADKSALKFKLKGMAAAERFYGTADIHPAWILEVLKNESPRIIGIIMRNLPSKHVRYILDRIDPEVKKNIPTLLESFAVPQDILEVVRLKFESNFIPIRVSKTMESFGFEHLCFLSTGELEAMLYELGMYEVAMALEGLSEKLLGVVLNRLKLKDAKRLYAQMQKMAGVSRDLKLEARYTILEIEGDDDAQDRLLVELGIESLGRAMANGSQELFSVLRQKLDPRIAYKLKRSMEEHSTSLRPEVVKERMRLVCECVSALAREERIDRAWERFSAHSDC